MVLTWPGNSSMVCGAIPSRNLAAASSSTPNTTRSGVAVAFTGLHGSYYNKSTPDVIADGAAAFTNVDLSDWATYKFVWKADNAGNQTIKYVVEQNGHKVVQTIAVNPPITQALSVVLWNDCSVLTSPTFGGCQQRLG